MSPRPLPELFIGLMSGTSLDGVDGVLCAFDSGRPEVRAHHGQRFDADLAAALLALNTPGDNELHRAALAANRLALVYAEVVAACLSQAQASPQSVCAIGAHGQTVRHRPGEFDGIGYTLQLNAPALLAERCGIPVVADFRSRDVAAGGQGAPLVPAFHQAMFAQPDQAVAVLNIGGMANLTVVPPRGLRPDGSTLPGQALDASPQGWDCGPGNVLMDEWCSRHLGQPYDAGGAFADSGQVNDRLLQACLAEPYFHLPPPKSTGRDRFHRAWLQSRLDLVPPLPAADVQATLCELTAQTCALAVTDQAPTTAELIVCGGGAFNLSLLRRLQAALPQLAVLTSDARGLPAMQVEATAFAWLAHAHVHQLMGNLPRATGAAGPRVLGAWYPG